jgi:hypothetical protein
VGEIGGPLRPLIAPAIVNGTVTYTAGASANDISGGADSDWVARVKMLECQE